MTSTYEIRMQDNPARERNEFAVYVDGVHCGYAKTWLAADDLRREILVKRQQSARCDCGSIDCPECSTGLEISSPPIDVAAGLRAMAVYVQAAATPVCLDCGGEGDCTTCDEAAWSAAVRKEYQSRKEAASAPAPAPRTPRRRKAAKPACTCPQCAPFGIADGIYRCTAGKEFIAYHAGLFVAAGQNSLHLEAKLNDYRHTLLSRPLPGATSEEVADVLAARR